MKRILLLAVAGRRRRGRSLVSGRFPTSAAGPALSERRAPLSRSQGFLAAAHRLRNAATVKTDWLKGSTYDEFQRSNLFIKLNGVYKGYGAAAGFKPDMASLLSLAGDQSALALYDLQHVQFAYITHLPESKVAQTRLWLGRKSFETRQASGVTFYINRDNDSTVAFATTNGYFPVIATGEERMAGMLGLLNGKSTSNIAEEGWYKQPAEASAAPGDLRLVMNLESLVESSYFRSYWIQSNTSDVRHFFSGVADIRRTPAEIREDRISPQTTRRARGPAAVRRHRGRREFLVPPCSPTTPVSIASGPFSPSRRRRGYAREPYVQPARDR